MGNCNPYEPRFELYNSDNTNFWSYDLKQNTVDPFQICVNFTCENMETETNEVAPDEIGEALVENGIDGYRFHNCVMDVSEETEDHNVGVSDRITYLLLNNAAFSPHRGKFRDITSCIKFFKNLSTLKINGYYDSSDLSMEFYRELSTRHFKYLSIEIIGIDHSIMPKMNAPYDDGQTLGDILLKIFEQTKRIDLSDNIWRILMDRPDVFQKALEKNGKRILSLTTVLIDQPDLTDEHLKMFTSFCPNGHGKICVQEMQNPQNLSRLFEYANQNQLKFKSLQVKWWPSDYHPSHACPSSKLHFWESDCLQAIKQILRTNPQINEISSAYNAVTAEELLELQEYIASLGMEIKTDGIRCIC